MKFTDYKKMLIDTGDMTESEIEAMELISKLELIRKRSQVTQTQLAKRVGMTQSQIAKIENLNSIPNLTTIIKMARGLGVDLSLTPIEQSNQSPSSEGLIGIRC